MRVLEVDELHAFYGPSHIIQGASLHVDEGEVVALLGRNGVGKTTLVKAIMGMLSDRRGRIVHRGERIDKLRSEEIARRGIGLVPQGRRIFASLTIRENLEFAYRPRQGGWTLKGVYEFFPRLAERERHLGRQLSGGEQSMLAIGRALMTNAALLIMDEPSEGLAPVLVRQLKERLQALKGGGQSIFLVEQNLELALAVANRIYIMEKGRVIHECLPHELEANGEWKHRYLGI